MKWFSGEIADAIQQAKTQKALFMVYITGEDEVSEEMNKTWEDATVTAFCERANVLGLKIEAKSESCTQFSQFYPVVCVPSTFFIGENGVPLEVCAGHLNSVTCVEKITKASEMHQQQLSSQNEGVPSPQPPAELPPQPSTSEVPAAQAAVPLEERVEVLKETIAQKQIEKEKKEEEERKRKEIERRELGKGLSKLKGWKEDVKRKETAAKWKKDKEEDLLARERVKQQIAQDRADRNLHFQKEKEERHQAQQARQTAVDAVQTEEQAEREAVRRESARIQFRLPDGSHITHEFRSQETLGAAREFLRPNIQMRDFQFTTTFPRRIFTEEHMQSSLLQLDLAPSAVLVVLPMKRQQVSASNGGGLSSLLWVLISPLAVLWTFLSNILFGAPPNTRGRVSHETSSNASTEQQSEASSSSTQQSARPKSSHGLRRRQEGNIHRLTSDDDNNDNATWNGNSTQQY